MPFLCKISRYTLFYKMRVSCDVSMPLITVKEQLKHPWPNKDKTMKGSNYVQQATQNSQNAWLKGRAIWNRWQEMTPILVTNLEPATAAESGPWCASRRWVAVTIKMTLSFLLERKCSLMRSGYRKRIWVDPSGARGWLYLALWCANQNLHSHAYFTPLPPTPLHTHTHNRSHT